MDRENIRFNVLRNALYHTSRRRSLERSNRICNLVVVLLGAAAVSDLATQNDINQVWIGAAVAVVGTMQLVLDFGRQARDHQVLQGQYYTLLAEIEEQIEPDETIIAQWQSRMIRITADEPPTLRALDAKAYNDAIDATGEFPPEERLVIPWYHRPLAGFVAFEGYNYLKVSERK